MNSSELAKLARDLKPYMAAWFNYQSASTAASGGSGGLVAHALDSAYHTGTLAKTQAPWAVTNDTFAVHVADANAHHPAAQSGAGINVASQVVSVALATTSGLNTTSGLAIDDAIAGSGLTISGKILAVKLAATSGLQLSANELALADGVAGNGLSIANKILAINLDANAGLAIASDALAINLASPSGLVLSGNTLALADSVAGDGLKITGKVLAINLATTSGLVINTDQLAINDSIAGLGLGISNKILAVNPGVGLAISGDTIAMGMPSTIGVGTNNNATGTTHIHQIDWDDAPGQTSKILGTDDSGEVTLYRAIVSNRLRTPLIDTDTGQDMTLQPTQSLWLDPASNMAKLAASVSLRSGNYVSQTTGMAVTYEGEGDFRYLFTDALHAKAFIADLEQALAGGQIIAKSVTKLSADWWVTARGASSPITVDDLPGAPNMAVFEDGDVIGVRTFSRVSTPGGLDIGDAFGVVTGYVDNPDGTQTWTFTRAGSIALGSGSLAGGGGTLIKADAIVIDYGVSGNGYYEVNAIDGLRGLNSPYSQIVTWTGGSPGATGAKLVRTRLGNLRGVFSQAGEYGLYAGTGILPTDQYLRLGSYAMEMHNLPSKWYNGSTQTVDISPGGTMWLGPSSTDKRLEFDGSNLKLRGDLVVGPGTGFVTDAVLYCAFDGSGIRGDYTGNANGHLGQLATLVGSPRFRPGKFGKAMDFSISMTNLIPNPSFEDDDVGAEPALWVNTYKSGSPIGGVGSRLVTNEDSWDGFQCLRIEKTGTANADRIGSYKDVTAVSGQWYVVTARLKLTRILNPTSTWRARVYCQSIGGTTIVSALVATEGEWVEAKVKIQADSTVLRTYVWLENCDSGILYVDAVQVVQSTYFMPYWGETVTPDSRPASYARIDSVPINWTNFTVSFWVNPKDTGVNAARNMRLFEARFDANNRCNLGINSTGTVFSYYAGANNASPFGVLGRSTIGATVIPADTWTHVAVTVGNKTITVYVNGVVDGTRALDCTPSGKAEIWLGAINGAQATETLSGLLDDFCLINRCLTAADIGQIALGNAPIKALASPFEFQVGGLGTDGSWRQISAYSGGLFGSIRDNAGNYVRAFSFLLDDITGTWAGITNPTAGDVIIGDASVANGGYLMWDYSASTLTIYGQAMLKGGVNVNTALGTGLYLGSDKMGYWSGSAWKTYMDNAGKFYLNAGAGSNYLSWNGTTLTISGAITVLDGDVPWDILTSMPTRYATDTGNPPAVAGLYITSQYMGYWSGLAWKAYISSAGRFHFEKDANSYLDYNGTTFLLSGNAMIRGGAAANTALGAGLYLGSDYMGYYNGGWKTWIASDGQFYFGGSSGARLQWDGTKLSGYSSSNEEWYASTVDGKLYGGRGSVWFDYYGLTVKRVPTSDTNFEGLPPVATEAAPESALKFYDSATTWTWTGHGTYSYVGNKLLSIYISSEHSVPLAYDPTVGWFHSIDGIIEMPALTIPANSGAWFKRLLLRNEAADLSLWGTGEVIINSTLASGTVFKVNSVNATTATFDITSASGDTVLALTNSDNGIGTGSNFLKVTKGASTLFSIRGDGHTGIGAAAGTPMLTVTGATTLNGATTIVGRLGVDGIDLDQAEYIAVGPYERLWRPNQQIAAANQGSYGPTLTYNATYDDVTDNRWEGIAGGGGGAPAAMGVSEGIFWFANSPVVTAGAAITWTNRLTITSTVATFTGNISATGSLAGTSGTFSSFLASSAYLDLNKISADPGNPTSKATARIFLWQPRPSDNPPKAWLVVSYNDNNAQKYWMLDLRSTTNQSWIYATALPNGT